MPYRSEIEKQRDQYARESDRGAKRWYSDLSGPLWLLIGPLLDSLATDTQGRLLFSVRNIITANQVGLAVTTYNQSAGLSFLGWVFRRLRGLFGLNRDYFATMPELNPESVEDTVRRLILLRYGFNPDTNQIDPNGYLASNVKASSQGQAIAQRINQALASKMNLNQFKREFRRDFNKPGSPLNLEFHYNRFARDLFQEFDRTAQLLYADELGLSHAIYSHTVKNNTRCFCRRRINKIYEVSFARKWNDQNWQGKKPGVDVMIAMGGYNCRGVWSFITEGTAKAISQKRDEKINSYTNVIC